MLKSLRSKLSVLIVLIVIISNALLVRITFGSFQSMYTEKVRQQMALLADKCASDIVAMNASELSMLRDLSLLPWMKDGSFSVQEKNVQLASLTTRDASHKAVYCVEMDGKTISADRRSIDFSGTDWFAAASKGQEYVSDPAHYYDGYLMYYAVPLRDQSGNIIGVVASAIDGNMLSEFVNQFDLGGDMHPGIMNMQTAHSVVNTNEGTEEENNAPLDPDTPFAKILIDCMSGNTNQCDFTDPSIGVKMTCSYRPVGDITPWVVFCVVPYSYHFGKLIALSHSMFMILTGFVLVSLLVGFLAIAKFIKPLIIIKKSIGEIATGSADLTKRLEATTKDEIGDVVHGFNAFSEKLQTIMKGLKNSRNELQKAGDELAASMKDSSVSTKEILDKIASVNEQIDIQGQTVSDTASALNEIASNIESLNRMIENQNNGVAQASSAVQQMIGNIMSVNETMDRMADSFEVLSANSQQGADLQEDVNIKIAAIRNQSETLQEANIAIASIAEQTNLLAMNAAIEAAHAGDAGKGFSVVADEIRKLSETSTAQSRTIGEELNSIRESIESVVQASIQSSSSFMNVTSKITETDELVRQIKVAMSEQEKGSRQISEALRGMNDSSDEVRAASKEMAYGNKVILDEIKRLQSVTESMKNSVSVMASGADRINSTSDTLSRIGDRMEHSIADIGSQIDEFKV